MTKNVTAIGNRMILASLILPLLVGSLASGLEISVSTNGIGMSEHLDLDDSTSFKGATALSEANIFYDLEAKGSGNNNIGVHASGAEYSVTNAVISSGDFQTSSSLSASTDSAIVSQSHQLAGDAGYLAADTISRDNEMHATGFFRGKGGNINANLVTVAGERSSITGDAQIAGIEFLNNEIAQSAADDEFGSMSAFGILPSEDEEIGNFGFVLSNTASTSSTRQRETNAASASSNNDRTSRQNEDIPGYAMADYMPKLRLTPEEMPIRGVHYIMKIPIFIPKVQASKPL